MNIVGVMDIVFLTIYFILITFIAFYIPGDVINQKIKIPHCLRICTSIFMGFIIWSWQSYILGIFSMRWMMYVVLVIFLIFWLRYKRQRMLYQYVKSLKEIGAVSLLISILGLVNILHNGFFNAIPFHDGVLYFSDHPPDQMWHAALAQSIVRSFPPEQPMMSGEIVSNYHIWGDMVAAEISRVFRVPISNAVFQYSSILIWLLMTFAIVSFARLNSFRRRYEWLLLYLFFISGDALMFLLFFLGKGFSFEMRPLESTSTIFMNFPRAYGLMIFIGGLTYLGLWVKEKKLYTGLLSALIYSSLLGFKANIGVAVGFGFLLLGGYFFYKKSFVMIVPICFFILLSLLVHLPLNSHSGGLVYSGFWMLENFIVQPALGLSRLELARKIFFDDGKVLKSLFFDLLYVPLFFFGIFGIKLLGFIPSGRVIKELKLEINIFLIGVILSSIVLGLFFIQSSGGSNSFNFISTAFHLLSIYTALFLISHFPKHKNLQILIIFLAIVITIPRSLEDSLSSYKLLVDTKVPTITNEKIEEYAYIKSITTDMDIFLSADLLFSIYTGRSVFLGEGSGLGILESHGISAQERLKVVNTIMESSDVNTVLRLIEDNEITYLLTAPSNSKIQQYFVPVEFKSKILMYKFNFVKI